MYAAKKHHVWKDSSASVEMANKNGLAKSTNLPINCARALNSEHPGAIHQSRFNLHKDRWHTYTWHAECMPRMMELVGDILFVNADHNRPVKLYDHCRYEEVSCKQCRQNQCIADGNEKTVTVGQYKMSDETDKHKRQAAALR